MEAGIACRIGIVRRIGVSLLLVCPLFFITAACFSTGRFFVKMMDSNKKPVIVERAGGRLSGGSQNFIYMFAQMFCG